MTLLEKNPKLMKTSKKVTAIFIEAAHRTLFVLDAKFSYFVIAISCFALFSFGSVTWVDSRSYIDIARELHGLEEMRTYHANSRLWYHSYVPLGLPLQWVLLEQLPTTWIWPVVTIFNRAVAAFALIYLTRSLQLIYKSPFIPLAGVIIALHPFYQAFQNAFLTEPMAMSLLMIGVGLAVRRVFGAQQQSGWFVKITLVIAMAVFFRANVALILICVALAVLFHLGKLLKPYAIVPVGVFFVLFLSYPLLVSQVTGELVFPRSGLSALVEGIRINPEPSANAITEASAYLPAGELERLLIAGADWSSALSSAERMRDAGVSNDEIMDRVEAAGEALRKDTWRVELRAWLIAGGAVGLPLDCRLAPSSYFSMRDLPVGEYCRLYFDWYEFHTWTGPRADIHAVWMRDFFTVEGREDLLTYSAAWTPYLHERAIFLRDPLYLHIIPIDLFALTFLISALILLYRLPWLGLTLIGIFLGNWIMYASVPFGGARYVYPLFPIYVFTIVLALKAHGQEPVIKPLVYIWGRVVDNVSNCAQNNRLSR